MKINPLDDFVSKYLKENNEIAKDILSVISNEEIVSAKDPRIARFVKHLGRAIVSNQDLLYTMIMEGFMEAERERERIEKEQVRIAKEEAIEATKAAIEDTEKLRKATKAAIEDTEKLRKAKEAAIQVSDEERKAKEAERKEKEYWKAQFEAMQQKNKGD